MNLEDVILFRQLSVIQKIVRDETWLEAERRGCPVPPTDRTVRENVCRIVLRIGQEMREAARTAIERETIEREREILRKGASSLHAAVSVEC